MSGTFEDGIRQTYSWRCPWCPEIVEGIGPNSLALAQGNHIRQCHLGGPPSNEVLTREDREFLAGCGIKAW